MQDYSKQVYDMLIDKAVKVLNLEVLKFKNDYPNDDLGEAIDEIVVASPITYDFFGDYTDDDSHERIDSAICKMQDDIKKILRNQFNEK